LARGPPFEGAGRDGFGTGVAQCGPDSSTVGETRPGLIAQRGEASGRKSLPRRMILACVFGETDDPTPSDSVEPSPAARLSAGKSPCLSATPLSRFDDLGGYCACSRLLSESFLCWRATAANSSAENRSDGLPYQLDRSEDRGDHDHDRRG